MRISPVLTPVAALPQGRILHLQRLSTEDGPGIRTTVFFKGCSLGCRWCHNPESIAPRPQVQWLESLCIGCGLCVAACPQGVLSLSESGVQIERACCVGCGTCAEACPTNAMELLGRNIGVEELLREVLKDRAYFESSAGGVTVSGGEPTLQPLFVADFLRRLQAAGVQTALDTCGGCSAASLEKILPHVNIVLFDLKEIDPQKHHTFTGQSNARVFENLRVVCDFIKNQNPTLRLWVRTPLIPGATATQENLTGLGNFITQTLDGLVERWDLCAFNNLCRDKYHRLGLVWDFETTPLMTAAELAACEAWAKAAAGAAQTVVVSGATRAL